MAGDEVTIRRRRTLTLALPLALCDGVHESSRRGTEPNQRSARQRTDWIDHAIPLRLFQLSSGRSLLLDAAIVEGEVQPAERVACERQCSGADEFGMVRRIRKRPFRKFGACSSADRATTSTGRSTLRLTPSRFSRCSTRDVASARL
jgi:hypothetical protein